MSEWVREIYRRPPSKARALALEKMGRYQQWRFSQEEATGRASCFLCFQSIPRGVAVRLLASSPLVMKTGDCKWLHLDCARGPGMFVESVCAPQVESARRKRKRTAAGVASGRAKCKLCKELLSPAEPYCQMFRADELEPYGRDRRNQLSRLYVHTECAAVVKRDLNWDSRFRPYQRLLLATIESRGADCQSAAPLVLALCLPRDILHSIAEHLEASSTIPLRPLSTPFAWHEVQIESDKDSGPDGGSPMASGRDTTAAVGARSVAKSPSIVAAAVGGTTAVPHRARPRFVLTRP